MYTHMLYTLVYVYAVGQRNTVWLFSVGNFYVDYYSVQCSSSQQNSLNSRSATLSLDEINI